MSKYIIEVDEQDLEFYLNLPMDSVTLAAHNVREALRHAKPVDTSSNSISREYVLKEFETYQYSKEFCAAHHIDTSIDLSTAKIIINEAPPVPQINIFCENADETAIEDMKSELQSVIETIPQGEQVPEYDEIVAESLPKVREAIKKVTNGDLYDRKGDLTKEGYEALDVLEGLDLFWICDPLIRLVSKKEKGGDPD